MQVLLLSAYHSASHKYWCEGLMAALPDINWTLKTQPARHFSWRVEASGLLWALADDADFERDYDLIVATSLSDLTRLRAFRPHLAAVPTWLYFHENQFAHPRSASQATNHQIGWQFLSIQNALCAEWVSFNTEFNRKTFLTGARALLRRFPEKLPGRPMERIEQRSDVLPVPLMDSTGTTTCDRDTDQTGVDARWNDESGAVRIVWAARWEWDKRPDRLLALAQALTRQSVRFKLAVLGDRGRSGDSLPPAFQSLHDQFAEHIVQFGYVASRSEYLDWLSTANVVVSTADHEFQGIAVLEAIQAGCVPVLPNRQAYPDWVPQAFLYESNDNVDIEATDAANLMSGLLKEGILAPDVAQFTWASVKGEYERRVHTMSGEELA